MTNKAQEARLEAAAQAAKTAADRWRTTTGYYVSDVGNRVVIRLTVAQADRLLNDVLAGRDLNVQADVPYGRFRHGDDAA